MKSSARKSYHVEPDYDFSILILPHSDVARPKKLLKTVHYVVDLSAYIPPLVLVSKLSSIKHLSKIQKGYEMIFSKKVEKYKILNLSLKSREKNQLQPLLYELKIDFYSIQSRSTPVSTHWDQLPFGIVKFFSGFKKKLLKVRTGEEDN